MSGLAQDSVYSTDQERLALLWTKRTREPSIRDYPLGPGDELEITVPGMEEFSPSRVVRVSSKGMITLPFVGVLQARGKTEEELKTEIRNRLENGYMYNPQVDVFVRHYRSRQVAVIGAVGKPGLYSLASGSDTLLDMISHAGGMTEEAATRIYFIPVEISRAESSAGQTAGSAADSMRTDSLARAVARTTPIVIDLGAIQTAGNQMAFALPARPGDVLMIPSAGEVLIEGWVKEPGSYRVTPGLSIVGAVAAAGGPLFAADTHGVKLIRMQAGKNQLLWADLEKIKRGESPDIPVQEGDVIEVVSSTAKLVPYGLYQLVTSIFSAGISVRP